MYKLILQSINVFTQYLISGGGISRFVRGRQNGLENGKKKQAKVGEFLNGDRVATLYES